MLDYNEFLEWLDFSQNLTSDLIQKTYKFMEEFPFADISDYMKACKKMQEGDSLEYVIGRYRRHMMSIGEKEGESFVEYSELDDEMIDRIWKNAKEGALKGETTHIADVDKCWKWRLGEFTLFTGYNNDGKSLFLRYLAAIKGLVDNWKFAFYAPEDFPAEAFFDDIIHMVAGYSTDPESGNFIEEALLRKIAKALKPLFKFVHLRPPKNTLENILKAFIPLIERDGIKVCVIDPMIKITRPPEYVDKDAAWSAYLTMMCTDFSRRYNVEVMVVLHQLTPKLLESGVYAKPDKYSIKSGGNLSDSSDNVLFLQRPETPRDMANTLVRFGSLKIKKQKLVGIPQEITFKFDRRLNQYVDETNEEPLFDFDALLDIPRANFEFIRNSIHQN